MYTDMPSAKLYPHGNSFMLIYRNHRIFYPERGVKFGPVIFNSYQYTVIL